MVRVRGLQVHGAAVSEAAPGQRVAVNLRGIEPAAVPRGAALAARSLLPPSEWLTVELHAVDSAPDLANGARLRLLFGTEEADARLRLLDRDSLAAGGTALAQLRCSPAVSVPARERFILRLAPLAQTVAGGRVLDPATQRQRRHAPAVLSRLRLLATGGPAEIVRAEVEHAGASGIPLQRLARLAGVAPARAAAALQGAVVLRSGIAVSTGALQTAMRRLPGLLQPHPQGLSREAVARLVPGAGAAVLDEALLRLTQSGAMRQERGLVRVVEAAREQGQAAAEAMLAGRLLATLRQSGLTPPDADALAPDVGARRLLDRLVREGAVVKASDRVQKRDLYFHPEAVAAARRQLAPRLREPGLLVREAGELLGISRKFSVPLLEHLDAIRFTRRIADRRVLAQS